MESAWCGADMRNVSLRSLVNKLREIKFGKLCLLERESIGRRVRSKYLCEDAIEEVEEEAEAGAFNRKGSTVRLYRKRSEGGKGLIGIEDCVRLEEANLAQYVQNSEEWLLKEVSEMALVSSVETGEELKKRRDVERKESLLGKPLHGKFFASFHTSNKSHFTHFLE